MDKPTKPSNLMPRSFGGVKNNWSSSMQTNGYEDGVPAIYGGDNLNYQLDATGKELDYCEKICDFINALPIGKTITVDANNKLVYDNLASIATTSAAGIVKPDGTTISIEADGTISVANLDYANKDLSNLTTLGSARLQYAPFSINAGTVINSNNHTLQSGSFIQSYTEAGSYTIEITEAGNYEIEMYGAGGGCANGTWLTDTGYCGTAGGGSGAGFKGVLTLAVGTYSITVGSKGTDKINGINERNTAAQATGGGSSTFGNLITATGGSGGYVYYGTATVGTGGTVTVSQSATVVSTSLNSSGNSGSHRGSAGSWGPLSVNGGASVFDGSLTGYGAGGGYPLNAQDGYFKITKLTGDASKIFCDPCTITTADGRTKVFDTASSIDISNQSDDSYLIFKNYNDGALSLASNLTISKTALSTPSSGDYWLDISTVPANLKTYDTSWTINNDLVYIGDCTVSSGAVSAISNVDFNATQQGEWVTLNSTQELAHVTSAGSNTLSFSAILPKDAYDYEVMCTLYFLGSSNSGGNSCSLVISDIKNPIDYFGVGAYGRLASWGGSLFLIDKKATFNMTFGSGATAYYDLWVTAYRRTGVV